MIIALVVHAGNIQDRDGAKLVLDKLIGLFPRLKLIWADGGYAGKLIEWTSQLGGWLLEIVKRSDDVAGFKVLPRRWIVERTFAWLHSYRRVVTRFEKRVEHYDGFVHLACAFIALNRLVK